MVPAAKFERLRTGNVNPPHVFQEDGGPPFGKIGAGSRWTFQAPILNVFRSSVFATARRKEPQNWLTLLRGITQGNRIIKPLEREKRSITPSEMWICLQMPVVPLWFRPSNLAATMSKSTPFRVADGGRASMFRHGPLIMPPRPPSMQAMHALWPPHLWRFPHNSKENPLNSLRTTCRDVASRCTVNDEPLRRGFQPRDFSGRPACYMATSFRCTTHIWCRAGCRRNAATVILGWCCCRLSAGFSIHAFGPRLRGSNEKYFRDYRGMICARSSQVSGRCFRTPKPARKSVAEPTSTAPRKADPHPPARPLSFFPFPFFPYL